MKYFLFDTETTGVYKKDEVIQFAGLLIDENYNLRYVINDYCYTNIPINPEAAKITKLDKSILWNLSEGMPFEKQFKKYDFLFNEPDITFVGWNISFDKRMINQTLTNNGYKPFDFGRKSNNFSNTTGRWYVDLMPGISAIYGANGGRSNRLKLSTAASNMKHWTLEELNAKYNYIYNKYGKEYGMKFHNALYDSFLLWALFLENKDKLRM